MLTYGSDFEMLLTVDGQAVAVGGGLIPGTKREPVALSAKLPGFMIQEDGVFVELNTPVREHTPGTVLLRGDMLRAQELALGFIARLVQQNPAAFAERKGLGDPYREGPALHGGGAYEFTMAQLMAVGEPAFVAGCDPDFSAYVRRGKVPNPPPDVSSWGNWRFAGGHLHLGYDTSVIPVPVMVRFLDLAVAAYGRHDTSRRGETYGQAGRFRYKSYGLEYRSCTSNGLMAGAGIMVEFAAALLRDKAAAQELYDNVNWESVRARLYSAADVREWRDRIEERIRTNQRVAA